ncbi:MAG: epoxyqueuosine reductase [Candidatus Petromonas sp.]|jgi:epoxyqueuosine reductase|nr:epoxyqueuosine reductase [Candidatus Petromonas sp.]
MNLKEKTIKYAKSIGIDLIGFVKSEVFEDLRERINSRKEKDYLSGFEEKDIEKRIDPQLTMKDAKTIIVVGVPYYIHENNINHDTNPEFYGKISRSSWGKDYHVVLKEKMKKLMELMQEELGKIKYRFFVDTGPLVDRHLAYKAGIGWYGKNNCIITENYGSWVFIGYILCDLEIETENHEENRCAKCNKCIDACPTGALMDNYEYNAKRCISFLTQTKEDISYQLREKMGNSLYGCDVCQLVCPHNVNVEGGYDEFFPEEHNYRPNLLELLQLSNKQFKKKYGDIALGWRGNKVLKRNTIIALGNSGDIKVLDHIKKYLEDSSPMIRKYAAWAAIRLDKVRGKKLLEEHLKKEKDPQVISEIKKLYKYYL